MLDEQRRERERERDKERQRGTTTRRVVNRKLTYTSSVAQVKPKNWFLSKLVRQTE